MGYEVSLVCAHHVDAIFRSIFLNLKILKNLPCVVEVSDTTWHTAHLVQITFLHRFWYSWVHNDELGVVSQQT